jgi:hypothetical protein
MRAAGAAAAGGSCWCCSPVSAVTCSCRHAAHAVPRCAVLTNDGDPANLECLEANLSAAAASAAAAAGIPGSSVHSVATPAGGRQWRLPQEGQQQADGLGLEPPLLELAHQEAGRQAHCRLADAAYTVSANCIPISLSTHHPLTRYFSLAANCRAHLPACSLLVRCKLEGRFYDLIDSDSFGAAAHCVGAALDAVRFGGLVCLTSTSGEQGELARLGEVAGQGCSAGLLGSPCWAGQLGQWCVVSESLIVRMYCPALPCPATPRAGTIAGGRDAANALALYGMHLAPVPSANEQVRRSGTQLLMPIHTSTTGILGTAHWLCMCAMHSQQSLPAARAASAVPPLPPICSAAQPAVAAAGAAHADWFGPPGSPGTPPNVRRLVCSCCYCWCWRCYR